MVHIHVKTQDHLGPLELWRHAIGHGGIGPLPLPDRVVRGAAALKPHLLRIFIQEFFQVYPDHDRFDWSRLDPYMDTMARTGAHVVAAITIKPSPLYPTVDHHNWRPTDTGEWQAVIRAMVHRYSVERPIVTHWEIGNEPDIGEAGGSPYYIKDSAAYAEYYEMTARAVLEAFPGAKVGGPAMADMHAEPLFGLIRHCAGTSTPLDFLSWHLYHSDPGRHGYLAGVARRLASEAGLSPELMVTEWNCDFPVVSVEDEALGSRRAAFVAAAIIDMYKAGLDRSFYYHLWDQVCDPNDFSPFFSEHGTAAMVRHWNEVPHRFGLFGVNGEVRPQYFVFKLLTDLGDGAVAASSDNHNIQTIAGTGAGGLSLLAVNHGLDVNRDEVASIHISGLIPGPRRLTVHRVDRDLRWDPAALALLPVEQRDTYVLNDYECQVLLPANSVTRISLSPSQVGGCRCAI
jgi:xylan 1,4-beta-xylosidase